MTSLAIDAPIKWTDNVLSQHDIPDVVAQHRGVARRISRPALLQLALARELHVGLGMSVRDALALARELLATDPTPGELSRGAVRIACDRSTLERTVDERLRDALESAPAPARGRPRRRGGG